MKTVVISSAVDASTTFTSGIFGPLGDNTTGGITAVFSGSTLAGTLQLQVSNDGTNFVSKGSSVSVTSAAGKAIDLTDFGYTHCQVVWTASSGTGTLTMTACIKETPRQ